MESTASNEAGVQYLILQEDGSFVQEEAFVADENKVLEALVETFGVERGPTGDRKNKWADLAKEYYSLTNEAPSANALKQKWRALKVRKKKKNDEAVRNLKASIAQALNKPSQTFQVRQVEDNEQGTSTTIVLINDEQQQQKEQQQQSHQQQFRLDPLDQVELDESGLTDDKNAALLAVALAENETVTELLKVHEDPKTVRKRLKWDRKWRVQEASFRKKSMPLVSQIEAFKTEFAEQQKTIDQMELELKQKQQRLQSIRNMQNDY